MSVYANYNYVVKNIFVSSQDYEQSAKLAANERVIHVFSSQEAQGHAGVNLKVLVEKTG